jgi:hypothetical protein
MQDGHVETCTRFLSLDATSPTKAFAVAVSRFPTLNDGTSLVSESIAQNVQTSPQSGLSLGWTCRCFFPMNPHSSSNCKCWQERFRILLSSKSVHPCPTRTPNRMIVSR